MSDHSLLLELFLEVEEALRRIERRFSGINSPEDFTRSDEGLDRLDGIGMMLIAISENIRKIDKVAGDQFLKRYPMVDWESVKGIRNVLAHDYFEIDADEIFNICSEELVVFKTTLEQIRQELLL